MSSQSTRPNSVRGLYTPPQEEWLFLPPTVQAPGSTAPSPPSTAPPPPFRPPPSLDDEDTAFFGFGLSSVVFRNFAAEYMTALIGQPFEVGGTLLQVEYRPRRRVAIARGLVDDGVPPIVPVAEDGDQLETISNPEEADVYFSDRLSAPEATFGAPQLDELVGDVKSDPDGYLPDLEPTWLLKDDYEVSRSNGVWGMIRRVRYSPTEGFTALWKGQLLSTCHNWLFTSLQPQMHSTLSAIIPLPSTGLGDLPLASHPDPALPLALQVASHLATLLLLSPLELFRTRLILAPLGSISSYSIAKRTVKEEGGLTGLYLHPNLLFPTIIEHTLRPLITLSIPLIIERKLQISPDIAPLTYASCDLAFGIATSLIMLPIETVRRRLQVQNRGRKKRSERTVVRVRDSDYVGVVDALWRIATEETAVPRKRGLTDADEGGAFQGLKQLYRGFGIAVSAHVTVFTLGLVSAGLGGRGFDGGWKEI